MPSYETGEVRKGVEHEFKHQRRISDQRQDGRVEVEGPELTSSYKNKKSQLMAEQPSMKTTGTYKKKKDILLPKTKKKPQ